MDVQDGAMLLVEMRALAHPNKVLPGEIVYVDGKGRACLDFDRLLDLHELEAEAELDRLLDLAELEPDRTWPPLNVLIETSGPAGSVVTSTHTAVAVAPRKSVQPSAGSTAVTGSGPGASTAGASGAETIRKAHVTGRCPECHGIVTLAGLVGLLICSYCSWTAQVKR